MIILGLTGSIGMGKSDGIARLVQMPPDHPAWGSPGCGAEIPGPQQFEYYAL